MLLMGINNCCKSVFITYLHFYAKLFALKSNNMGESSKSSTKVRHFCKLCTKYYAYRFGLCVYILLVLITSDLSWCYSGVNKGWC